MGVAINFYGSGHPTMEGSKAAVSDLSEKEEKEILHILQEEANKGRGWYRITSADLEATLHKACENGWVEVTRLLLEVHSLDPNALDYRRTNLRPLHLAARGGHEELVEYLINKGARVDGEDFTGSTALHHSMREGEWSISERLVSTHDANLLKCNGSGEVPLLLGLDRAIREEEEEKGKKMFHSLLVMYDRITLPCSIQYTIIKSVYQRDWREELLYLLQIDEKKSKGKTVRHSPLLLTVAINGDEDVCDFLLENNADYTITDEYGNTALHHAISNGHFNCVKVLLRKAPSLLSVCNKREEGVVRFAVWTRSHDMVLMLVEAGAKADQEDIKGDTPLLSAIRQDSRGIAEYLVKDLQCDIISSNKNGVSPLSSELMDSLQCRNTNKALWLLSLVPINAKSLSKDCLYLACQQGMMNVIDVLLQICHCDPFQLSPVSGLTPYHAAIKERSIAVLQHLLAYKTCPLSLAAANGITVVEMAKNCPGAAKVLELGRKKDLSFAQKVVKVFVLGEDGVGKSSLAHAVKVSNRGIGGRRGTIKKREPSLGIKVRKVDLAEAGPVLLYDCPSSIRYQRPNVLRKLVSGGYPSLFIIVTDVRKSKDEVGENVSSWADYINSIAVKGSYVIVTGSYADESTMSQWGFQDGSSIGEYCTNVISGGAIMVDTRSVRSRQVNDLLSMLAQSIASLRSTYTGKPLQFQHLALYVFLNERLVSSTVSLPVSNLMEMIEGDSYYNDIDLSVKESLAILEDKGLVLNLENKVHDQSILVLQPYLLLNNILNAIITSPTSDNGLIEERAFLEALPGIAPQLVSLFLQKFSLCLSLQSPPTLSFGTLSTVLPLEKMPTLFFPSKVTREAPDPDTVGRLFNSMDSYRFGWFIEPTQSLQFPIDILHAIQMEILSLDNNNNSCDSEGSTELAYHVWSRGVHCVRGELQFVVEQENGEQVTLFMSCLPGDEFKLVKQRGELLAMIRRVTSIISDKNEFIISPVHLQSYPLNGDTELVVHDVSEVASALSEGRDSLTSTEGTVSIKELLYFESYQYFPRPSIISTSLTNEEEKLESFISQSSVPESDSVLVSMIATHLLGLSDDAVTEVMAGALGDGETGATGTSSIVSGLFKKWAQNIPCSSLVNNLEEILNRSSIQ